MSERQPNKISRIMKMILPLALIMILGSLSACGTIQNFQTLNDKEKACAITKRIAPFLVIAQGDPVLQLDANAMLSLEVFSGCVQGFLEQCNQPASGATVEEENFLFGKAFAYQFEPEKNYYDTGTTNHIEKFLRGGGDRRRFCNQLEFSPLPNNADPGRNQGPSTIPDHNLRL